jgi:hypothetical protein
VILLVARSVAVYLAAAGLFVWVAHRFVTPIRRRVALALIGAPLLLTGPATFTGGVYAGVDILYDAPPFQAHRESLGVAPVRSPVLADVVEQHIPWRASARRAIAAGRLPLWNPDTLVGEPLLAVQQAGVLQPGTWIGMLLPMPQAWTFDMSLRLLIALLSAYLLFRDLGCGALAALLGAAGWAFSDFFVVFLGFSIAPPTAPFPLMLLGARRVAREPGGRSGGLLAAALVLGLMGGHPETVLHTGAASALYFVFELARSEARRVGKALAVGALSSGVAFGLSAVVLLPLAEILPSTAEHVFRNAWYAHSRRSVEAAESVFRLVPQIVPYAVGVDGHSRVKTGFLMPSAYAGALLLPFAFSGLFARRRERWFFLGLGLLALSVCTKTAAADWITKLPLFDIAINEYLIVVSTMSLCVLAALGAERLVRGEGRRAFAAGAVGSAALIVILNASYRSSMYDLRMPPAYLRERLALQLVPLLLGAALTLGLRRRPALGLGGALFVFTAARILEVGRINPTIPAQALFPDVPILAKIPRGSPERMAAVGATFIPNASAVYDLEDVRGYSALSLSRLRETYPLWCALKGGWFNFVDDPATPFLAFLGTHWVLLPPDAPVPPGWPVLAESDGLRLVENPRALPRAFAPRFWRAESDPAKRLGLLGEIRDFRERGIIEGQSDGSWTENGRARIAVEAYRPESLVLKIETDNDTVIGTSITLWPGWMVDVDGVAAPTFPFNHAFVGFRIAAGSHRVVLRYFPKGVRNGLAVSGATLAVLIAGVLVARRRGGRSEGSI